MNAFEILGIAETKDTKVIRRAYSRLLAQFSPEKDPEGFQRLRAAYEEALSKASEVQEVENKALNPVDEFMQAFEETYKNFEKRIEVDSWQQLLESEVCYNIDSSKEVSHRILKFLMDNYNFPAEVWRFLNTQFNWTAKKDVLYNSFPSNFIDFVIYKINNDSTFDYKYLRNCKEGQQDKFIEEFRKVDRSLETFDLYTAETSIKAAEELCPGHPGLKLSEGRYFSTSGRFEEAFQVFEDLIQRNDKDYDAFYYRADLYFQSGRVEEAYEDYKRVVELLPDSLPTFYILAKCCICLKKYEEAIEYATKLDDVATYREDIRGPLNSAYSYYIDRLKEKLEQGSVDDNIKFKLADAYYKTSRMDESLDILNELMQNKECSKEVYNLYCRILTVQKKFELAYVTITKALEYYNGDYALNFLLASILDDLGRDEESIEQYDRVIALGGDNSLAYNNKAYVLNKIKRYNEALVCANQAISLNPSVALNYKNKAAALLGLELYEDCLDTCEQALSKYQYLTEVYVIKMKAFIDMSLFDEALSVYNRAADYNLKDAKLYYEKARTLMYKERYEEAIDNCDLGIEKDSENPDLYHLKGLCYYYKEDCKEAVEWFDNAIKKDMYYSDAYYFKIKSLLSDSNSEKANEVIENAINLKLHQMDRFYSLKASVLKQEDNYEEAAKAYRMAIEINPKEASYYYSLGHAVSDLDRHLEAIEHYSKYVEMEPEVVEGYVNISHSLYCLGRFEECIDYCDRAINVDPDYILAHQNKAWALYNLKQNEEAEKECNIALKIDSDYENVLSLKLKLLKTKERYSEALVLCEKLLLASPDNKDVKNTQRELLEKIRRGNNPIKSLFKSIVK